MTDEKEASFGMIYPQMWGQSVIEQYRKDSHYHTRFTQVNHNLVCSGGGNYNLPDYVSEKVKDNRRKLVTSARVPNY